MLKAAIVPLYVVATLFPRLLSLPAPLGQVQLTEILFLPALYLYRRELYELAVRYRVYTYAVGLYVLAGISSGWFSGSAGSLLEASARGYLAVVPVLVVAHVRRWGASRLLRWWVVATCVVAAGGVLYYLSLLAGWTDRTVGVGYYGSYPYLGDLFRLRATASTPGMWMMLLLPGFLYLIARPASFSLRGYGSWIIAAAMLLTFSKEMVLVVAGTLLLCRAYPRWRTVLIPGLFAFVLLGTHFLVVNEAGAGAQVQYLGGKTYASVGNYELRETVYLPIKRVALRVGWNHPILGVGPGRFVDYSEGAALAGELPADFGSFDPHSAWTGAFAETGLIGLITLLGLVAALWFYRPEYWTVPAVLLLLFLVASVFKDVMNFRGLWVVVGLYLSERTNSVARLPRVLDLHRG